MLLIREVKNDYNMKRAVCLFAVGKVYNKQCDEVLPSVKHYAEKVGAEVVVVNTAPDPTFRRNILSQKLLLPSLFTGFDEVVFFDCDIAINDNAANIFDLLPSDKGFAAVVDDRSSESFKKTWAKFPQNLNETNETYFTNRGFKAHPKLLGSINGGVFVFRPQTVAKLFAEFYFSEHGETEHEECAMAYLTQINNIFANLPLAFNTQMIYLIRTNFSDSAVKKWTKYWPGFISKQLLKYLDVVVYPSSTYKAFAKKALQDVHILHFAGKYPIVR